jgi:murein L,D-transpeptidase YafK
MIRNISLSFALLGLALAASAETTNLVPSGLLRLGSGNYYSSHVVVADKANRKVSVWKNENGKVVKIREYDNDLGKAAGDKVVEGDNKTPEGIFFFQKILEGNQIPFQKYGVRAITTNYPNLFDKRENKTGYGIWLHGIPDEVGLQRGSEGCVVLSNKHIMEISDFIHLKNTAFLIEDKLELIPASELTKKKTEIEEFLKAWRRSWIQKDIETYMSHYSDKFYSSKRNKEQWKAHKDRLNKVYDEIYVDFSDPVAYEVDKQIIVRTLQHYKSTHMDDYGEKTLYLEREEDNSLKIIAETWKSVDHEKAKQTIASGTILRDTRLSSTQEFTSQAN